MKKARVSSLKNNITVGSSIPFSNNDCDVGNWVDSTMTENGYEVDPSGIVDLPDLGIDNKSRNRYSKANHTIGSMTIDNILKAIDWEDTRFYQKSQNQNQIEYDPDFMEVTKVTVLDMDIDATQEKLKTAYIDLRNKLEIAVDNKNKLALENVTVDLPKEIKSNCGWAVLDGYNHSNSYRMRITNKAMTKIKNIAGNRDTWKRLMEEA